MRLFLGKCFTGMAFLPKEATHRLGPLDAWIEVSINRGKKGREGQEVDGERKHTERRKEKRNLTKR